MGILNFTAIDFEIANPDYASVCAVGMTKVRNSEVVDSRQWLVKPSPGLQHFGEHNIRTHGIRPEDVVDAIGWGPSLERIVNFVGDDSAVAYSIPFDSGVLKAACNYNDLEVPPLRFLCAKELSKTHLELSSYRLPDVAGALGLPDFEHHQAGADADTCAAIVLAIADRRHPTGALDELWSMPQASRLALQVPQRRRSARTKSQWPVKPRLADLPQPNPDADPAGPLFDQVVLFSGDMPAMSKEEARMQAALRGAGSALSLTSKTTLLVMGSRNASERKKEEALKRAGTGQEIRVISETEFTEMLSVQS